MLNGYLTDEIRINSKYAHVYRSEYPDNLESDSIPIVHRHSLLTEDYLRRMTSGISGNGMSILPPNCRYIENVKQGNIVIIEEPPAFRTISIYMSFTKEVERLKAEGKLAEYGFDEDFARESMAKRFTLAFPYVIFILYFTRYNELSCGQAYLRVARLSGLSDYLLKIPLTNIAESQYICFGSKAGGSAETLNAGVEKVIDVFWGAEFNTDYTYNYTAYRDIAGVNSYMEWQALSASNPMFIYNVDWMKIPMNIGQALDEVKRHYKLSSSSDIQYKNLSSMFSVPLDSGKDEAPTKRSRKKYRLFYDVAQGIFLDENYYVHVGDSFQNKSGTMFFINSFISFADSGDVKYVRVEREDGRLIVLKFTKSVSHYLKERTKALRYEAEGILKNGVVVKENDIIKLTNAIGDAVYKKVTFIRKSQEGFHEGRFGDGFYILENTEGEVYDVTNPEYRGIKLKKNTDYLYMKTENEVPFNQGCIVNFTGIEADNRGRLNIDMTHKDNDFRGSPYKIPLNQSNSNIRLYEMDQVKPLPPVFRLGRKLLVNRKNDRNLYENSVFGTPYGIIYDSGYGNMDKANPDEIKKYMLGEDKFQVKSFDLDIEFNIGDKVVVADFENPINMLSVKTIQGFKFTEGVGDIHFILADKQGNLHQEEYVKGRYGTIHTGRIRKISNVFGELTAGTKIKSNIAGFPHFAKKDTNIIIGFLTDTGGPDPLVLCSNCCTMWYRDVVECFKHIPIKSAEWAKTAHSPIDVAKIKYQPGDILIGTGSSDYRSNTGWLLFKVTGSNSIKAMDFNYYNAWPDYFTLDRYITTNSKFDCIPNPRIGPKAQSEMEIIRSWPNMHGYYFSCDKAKFRFLNDERSMVNVQSSSE